MKYAITQNSDDTRDARCSNDEEQRSTHHDFNEGEDTLLHCCIANNPRISFSCHSIRDGNSCYRIFVLDMFPALKILINPLSHYFTSKKTVITLVLPKKKAKITSAKRVETKKLYQVTYPSRKPCFSGPRTSKKRR